MEVLQHLNASIAGYRTLLSSCAAILSALAMMSGVICPTTGGTLIATFLAISQICQRLATANSAAEIIDALSFIRGAGTPPAGQVVLKLFGDDEPNPDGGPSLDASLSHPTKNSSP
jgi:hypothetical protein